MTLYQYPDYLMHHGVKGMRWGHRKKYEPHPRNNKYNKEELSYDVDGLEEAKLKEQRKERRKKIIKIGLGITAGLLVAYGAYKISQMGVETSSVVSTTNQKKNLSKAETKLKEMEKAGDFGNAKVHTEAFSGDIYNRAHLYDSKLVNSLSKNEKDAIVDYTGMGYKHMNGYLRASDKEAFKKSITPKNSFYAPDHEAYQRKIKDMTNALEKSSLKEDVVVHRGIGGSLSKMLGVDKEALNNRDFQNSLRGTVFTEKGFFSSGGSTKDCFGGVKIHAKVPKGSKGMYVAPISQFSIEHEFILQRNSSFKISDFVRDDKGEISDLIVELIDQTIKD